MIILYGFESFGKRKKNSSWEMLKDFKAKDVKVLQLPVNYENPAKKLIEVIDRERPDVVLGFGQFAGIPFPIFERIAVNLIDSKHKDDKGRIIHDKPIAEGPVAYFTTIPNKKIIRALKKEKITAKMSQYLSLYICNQVLYEVLNHVEKRGLKTKVGHVHVPILPEQLKEKEKIPTMPLKDLKKALKIIVRVLKTNR